MMKQYFKALTAVAMAVILTVSGSALAFATEDKGYTEGLAGRNSFKEQPDVTVNTKPIPLTESAASLAIQNAKDKKNGTIAFRNINEISVKRLDQLKKAAGNDDVRIVVDCYRRGVFEVGVSFPLQSATKAINPFALVSSQEVVDLTDFLRKKFSNQMMVVRMESNENFEMPVKITLKLDRRLDADKLVFYRYDAANKECLALNDVTYAVNENGYLTFTTQSGGAIVITQNPLKRR